VCSSDLKLQQPSWLHTGGGSERIAWKPTYKQGGKEISLKELNVVYQYRVDGTESIQPPSSGSGWHRSILLL